MVLIRLKHDKSVPPDGCPWGSVLAAFDQLVSSLNRAKKTTKPLAPS